MAAVGMSKEPGYSRYETWARQGRPLGLASPFLSLIDFVHTDLLRNTVPGDPHYVDRNEANQIARENRELANLVNSNAEEYNKMLGERELAIQELYNVNMMNNHRLMQTQKAYGNLYNMYQGDSSAAPSSLMHVVSNLQNQLGQSQGGTGIQNPALIIDALMNK